MATRFLFDFSGDRTISDSLTENAETDVQELHQSGLVQQYSRHRKDSTEYINGIFRCDFDVNQKRYALNIPIHPPLFEIPTVEAIGIDCDVRIRVTDCQRFGVRIEIAANDAINAASSRFVDVVISSSTTDSTNHD